MVEIKICLIVLNMWSVKKIIFPSVTSSPVQVVACPICNKKYDLASLRVHSRTTHSLLSETDLMMTNMLMPGSVFFLRLWDEHELLSPSSLVRWTFVYFPLTNSFVLIVLKPYPLCPIMETVWLNGRVDVFKTCYCSKDDGLYVVVWQ